MTDRAIGFIGGGNMALSLIGGLLSNDWPAAAFTVADPDEDKRRYFRDELGLATTDDNDALVRRCDVVVLAVKPQVLKQVVEPLAGALQAAGPLVVSIAAGVREADIRRWIGGTPAVVRVMPNTPALVGSGASGLYANENVSAEQRDLAESVMRAVGVTAWIRTEQLLDVVTALSGSGPAYYLYVMDALERAAVDSGLPAETAHLLTLETALGTAKLALESDESLSTLRERVTSPGGTTERAVEALKARDVEGAMREALAAAAKRAGELGDILGES